MDADRTLRIIVLPAAPSAKPMIDLLRVLIAQSVIDPPILLVDATFESRVLAQVEDEDEILPLAVRIETATCERFLLINLVTADAIAGSVEAPTDPRNPAAVPALATAVEVDLFIRNALAARSSSEGFERSQTLEVVNLAVPAASVASLPRHLHTFGPRVSGNSGGWRNLVVTPEVQETSLQATVPITADENYIAHAVVSLVTIAGCWAGASWEPELPSHQPDVWAIMRSRSRSMIAPELPIRVLGRIGRTASQIPIHDQIEFQVAPQPDYAVQLGLSELIERHHLGRAPFADVSYRPPKRRVGLREFFRILWGWLTGRLPQIVGGVLEERVRDIRNQADRVINSTLGLDADSDLEVRVFGVDETQVADQALDLEDKERIWQFLTPEPDVWSEVRATSFGLIDGADVPDPKLQRLLGVGDQRFVLGDRTWICPPPDVALWDPPKEIIEMRIGPPATVHVVDIDWADAWQTAFDQAILPPDPDNPDGDPADPLQQARATFTSARDKAKRSFLWALGEHLVGQRNQIVAHLADLRDQLVQAKEFDEKHITAEGNKMKRRAWIKLALKILLIVALAVGIWWLVGWLALTGVGLVLIVAVGVLVLLYGFVRSLWRCVYNWFLADHTMLWLRKGRIQVLEEAIAFDEVQLRRFTYLCFAQQEWADVIAQICFNPFRRPEAPRHRRVRCPELALPSSHQIAEGFTTSPRLDGLVSAAASTLIEPGWLGITYDSARSYATEEHKLRTRGGAFDPDIDRNMSPEQIGPRRALKDAILTGRARHRRELEVLRLIHEALRSGAGFLEDPGETERAVVDRLFTPLPDGQTPAEFLAESTVGEPSNFNREYTPFDQVPERSGSNQTYEVELPELPTTEEMIEGATVVFPPVVFTSWSIEMADGVSVDALPIFTATATPAGIDLGRALTLWLPPAEEDFGEIDVSAPGDRPGWVLEFGDLPTMGQVVRPSPDARQPVGRGSYRFMIEEDGEPLSHPIGVPLRYAVREDCAPPGFMTTLARALQRLADHTGYEFEFAGTFLGLPQNDAGRIEIGWAFDEEFMQWQGKHRPDYQGRAIGWGGPGSRLLTGVSTTRVLNGGLVLLHSDMTCVPGFVPNGHGEVLLHELGHVMNLAHVPDDRELMHSTVVGHISPLDYGLGDHCGLRELVAVARRV